MEEIFGLAFVVALGAFVLLGLAVGSSAEGSEAAASVQAPRPLRITRAALLLTAAILAILGAEAGLVSGSSDDPASGRSQAVVFLLEGAADLILAWVVFRPTWTLRKFWVLRLVSVCWLVVGPPGVILNLGHGPAATFYLGLGPSPWAALALLTGVALVWLASLGGVPVEGPHREGPPPTPAATPRFARAPAPPTHWRGIVTAAVLASIVAISAWPMAQFAGVIAQGGCMPQWLVPSDPGFCVSGSIDGSNVNVSGHTTLPEGSLVDVTATGLDSSTTSGASAHQRLEVLGGTFQATFISFQGHGPIVVTATLSMDGQLPAVLQRYGPDGHGLTGPAAGWHCGTGGGRCVSVSVTFPAAPAP